ncbi:MAG TPA: hypothetical protein VN764_00615, partial [Polyangiaceae bacterium]|nr:hypothetical protein [Polyangiaceae bacterium]
VRSETDFVHAHPDVQRWIIEEVLSNIRSAAKRVSSDLKLEAAAPLIWVHPDPATMRKHSCVNDNAVAYYDGAIHLAPLEQASGASEGVEMDDERRRRELVSELRQSLTHELVHHVLVSNGVGKPIWLQEGVATMIAGDQPADAYALFKKHRVEVSTMTDGPAPTATLGEANVYYAHAYVMVEFLDRLCLKRTGCGWGELTQALTSGAVLPEELFDWATGERAADLAASAEVSVWQDYVERGNFAPATYELLLHRPSTPVHSSDRL